MVTPKKVDKYVNLFVEKTVKEKPGQKMPLNVFYQEYKLLLQSLKMQPLLYRDFRTALIEILGNSAPLIEVKKVNRRWYVYNVALVTIL